MATQDEIQAVMNQKPLPCPFCGKSPDVRTRKGATGESPHVCFVACYCGTYSAHAHQQGRGDTALEAQRDAYSAWNRRDGGTFDRQASEIIDLQLVEIEGLRDILRQRTC